MKSQFQDIIPPEKRSIRNVPLSANPENVQPVTQKTESILPKERPVEKVVNTRVREESVPDDDFSSKVRISNSENLVFKGKTGPGIVSRFVLWGITLAAVAAAFFVVTYYYTVAEISIETKKYQVTLPDSIKVSLNPTAGAVDYSVITFSDSMEASVDSALEKEVKDYAKGTIVVYNKYDINPQKFTEGTRFETTDGKIFRTTKAVTVPGLKKVNGVVTPGSVQVEVIADKPGEAYNIDLSDFTVPGLKNDPRFDSFYARSKTKIAGGFVGKIPEISKENQDKVVLELQDKLTKKVQEKVKNEIPKNQLLIDGLTSLEFKTLTPKSKAGKAVMSVAVTLKAYVVQNNSFVKNVLGDKITNTSPNDEFIIKLADAHASMPIEASTSSPVFSLQGSASIEYVFDTAKFKTEVLGKTEVELMDIVHKYPAIKDLNLTIKPFWKNTVPNDIDKINIKVD
jgi:hypothetical protein